MHYTVRQYEYNILKSSCFKTGIYTYISIHYYTYIHMYLYILYSRMVSVKFIYHYIYIYITTHPPLLINGSAAASGVFGPFLKGYLFVLNKQRKTPWRINFSQKSMGLVYTYDCCCCRYAVVQRACIYD